MTVGKKHTFKEVKKYFEDHDCKLSETEYINANTSMKYECSCGNPSKITFGNFRRGSRCNKCSTLKVTHTFKYVKQYFKDNGCELLETEYINSQTKMRYRCSCKNIEMIKFNGFWNKKHKCCSECLPKRRRKIKSILTYKDVYNYFKKYDCELLEKEYINNKVKMRYRCSCGHISKISFGSFKSGHRCKKCSFLKRTHSYKDVYNYFKKYDCELFETEYINGKTKMRYRCSCGNKSKITFNDFKSGRRCKECGKEKRKRFGKNHWGWIEDREDLEEINRFKSKCRSMLRSVLKRIGKPKNNKTFLMLGYDSEQLRKHVYSHPNWEKVKDNIWHLDHYHPIKAFLDYGIRDIKLINCLENLQPLTDMDNFKKGSKYDVEEFEEWLVGKGYEIIRE